MEKTSSIPPIPGFGGLHGFFAKKFGILVNRVLPAWSTSQIDSRLFIAQGNESRKLRVPRGFAEITINSDDGKIQAYQTGKGPTVVFVHGWGGSASQFFPLMRGLAQCGFTALAFDHLGHGMSERKPATLQQCITTTNFILNHVRRNPNEGLSAVVGHSTGCIAIANARPAMLKDAGLFLISPVFNFKLYFLKKLVKLGLHADLVKQYANRFGRIYRGEYQKLELGRNLDRYSDVSVIVHDESDTESSIKDSTLFCARYPLTKLMVTRNFDHVRVINSESVWQELKSHLNYDDTTINFTAEVIYR